MLKIAVTPNSLITLQTRTKRDAILKFCKSIRLAFLAGKLSIKFSVIRSFDYKMFDTSKIYIQLDIDSIF